MGGAKFATKNENKSLGFNLEWDVNDRFGLELDFHDSTAESGPDSPYGSNAVLGVAGFYRGTTTGDFTQDFPVMSVALPPGQTGIDASQMQVTGSSFRNSYMKSEIQQGQLSGNFDFTERSRLDFGVALTEVNNRSAFSNVQQDSWGGATQSGRLSGRRVARGYGPPVLRQDLRQQQPEPVQRVLHLRLRDGARHRCERGQPGDVRGVARLHDGSPRRGEIAERLRAVQPELRNGGLPMHARVGVRYEKTDVTSSALVPTATGIVWVANNEFSVHSGAPASFTTLEGDYDYVLPSFDFSIDVTDTVKVRASYGESIGRPGWGDIQGGQTLDQLVRINGGTGAPGQSGPEAAGVDRTSTCRSSGTTPNRATCRSATSARTSTTTSASRRSRRRRSICPIRVRARTSTKRWRTACPTRRPHLHPQLHLRQSRRRSRCGRRPIRTATVPASSRVCRAIRSRRSRSRCRPTSKSATLDGWEFNVQHIFGESGFGVAANYTLVDSDLTYDNQNRGEQFALEGLSDSANLVAFYEKYGWSGARGVQLARRVPVGPVRRHRPAEPDLHRGIRAARPERQLRLDRQPDPAWRKSINLTDEIQRLHGRTRTRCCS